MLVGGTKPRVSFEKISFMYTSYMGLTLLPKMKNIGYLMDKAIFNFISIKIYGEICWTCLWFGKKTLGFFLFCFFDNFT
jgi:hypothetical protein